MRVFLTLILSLVGLPALAGAWHEYGQCVILEKIPAGAFDQRLRSVVVATDGCVKDTIGGQGGFETRFTWENGQQNRVNSLLDRQTNILEVEFNGASAMILDAAMYAPYHDCYGLSKAEGLQVHCFIGSGMPIQGTSQRRAEPAEVRRLAPDPLWREPDKKKSAKIDPVRGFERVFGEGLLPQ